MFGCTNLIKSWKICLKKNIFSGVCDENQLKESISNRYPENNITEIENKDLGNKIKDLKEINENISNKDTVDDLKNKKDISSILQKKHKFENTMENPKICQKSSIKPIKAIYLENKTKDKKRIEKNIVVISEESEFDDLLGVTDDDLINDRELINEYNIKKKNKDEIEEKESKMRENEKIKFDKEMIKYNEDLKKEKEQFDKIEMERKYKFIEMNEKRVLNDRIVEKKEKKIKNSF